MLLVFETVNVAAGKQGLVFVNGTGDDGVTRTLQNQGAIGDIWRGSSIGPTFDGRLGVDFTAPGDSVFTTLNPTSYFSTFRFNHNQDGNGFYTRAGAVSAAAPQVTGIIALMLERNPRLDAVQIRAMLRNSARADSFTGAVPNATWGYGKVDALNAVRLAAQSARTQFDWQIRHHGFPRRSLVYLAIVKQSDSLSDLGN